MFAKYAAAAATCLIAALTPAQASSGCLTHSEARQMFRTSYLYWHGKDHCWDGSAVANKHASIAGLVHPRASRTSVAVIAKPSNEVLEIGSSSPANSGNLKPTSVVPELRQWSNTMAMAETTETTPWINRWPDQAIVPPSPALITLGAAHVALASPRGMAAGIMISLAILEVLFGGIELGSRLLFGMAGALNRLRWTVPLEAWWGRT